MNLFCAEGPEIVSSKRKELVDVITCNFDDFKEDPRGMGHGKANHHPLMQGDKGRKMNKEEEEQAFWGYTYNFQNRVCVLYFGENIQLDVICIGLYFGFSFAE